MTTEQLTQFSESLADSVSTAAPSVVQIHGAAARRAGSSSHLTSSSQPRVRSGVRMDYRCVVTMVRPTKLSWLAGIRRRALRCCVWPDLQAHHARNYTTARRPSRARGRTIVEQRSQRQCGHHCGHRRSPAHRPGRAIDQVLRTTAPMHDGFAGGALVNTAGALLGVITSTRIRGTTVVIPASIAWKTASSVLEHGGLKRGYLGIAGQPVRLPANQRPEEAGEAGLLVAAVTPESPAAAGGLLVGDIILALDANPIESPEISSTCCGETGLDRGPARCPPRRRRHAGTHYCRRASKGLMKVVLVGPPALRVSLRTP